METEGRAILQGILFELINKIKITINSKDVEDEDRNNFSGIIQDFCQTVVGKLEHGEPAPSIFTRSTWKKQENLREMNNLKKKLIELDSSITKNRQKHEKEKAKRLEIVKNLEIRKEDVVKKTTACLQMAKECGEEARADLLKDHKNPLERRQLKVELLEKNLETLLKENEYVENQLTQCRKELRAELETLQRSYEAETKEMSEKLRTISRRLSSVTRLHETLTTELEGLSAEYEAIVDKKRQEEQLGKLMAEEKVRREEAAVKIQRWFRFLLFRRRLRRKHNRKSKSSRMKNSKSDKANATAASPRKSPINVDRKKDPVKNRLPNMSAGKIITKSAENGSSNSVKETDTCENLWEPVIRKSAVEIKEQGSQTDGRVPKSKRVY